MTKARDLANLISGGFTEADIPNLSASKITSGTFADARLSQSSVQQYASTFDDNKIVNDISTLGLRVHTQENLNASNTSSASFDVFQDSSGIANLTNVSRNTNEFMSSVVQTPITDFNYTMEHSSGTGNNTGTATATSDIDGSYTSTTRAKFGSRSLYGMDSYNPMFKWYDASGYTGDFTFQVWFHTNGLSANTYHTGWRLNFATANAQVSSYKWRSGFGGGLWVFYRNNGNNAFANNGDSAWWHHAVSREGNTMAIWSNGTRQHTWTQNASSEPLKEIVLGGASGSIHHTDTSLCSSYFDGFVFDRGIRSGFEPSNSTITPPTSQPSNITTGSSSATGSFEGNPITASSTNKMGAVITYQDNAGTNSLNSDIVLKLSADNGSNYSTATLTALPDFATGIKMAKVNDLSVTAGTQLKYKIEFANQASGSKEARIRGVSLQY